MKLAVIGCGKQAAKHVQALKEIGIERVSVADMNQDRARALAERFAAVATTSEAIMADREVDAVLVCTPTATHERLVGAALAAGKHAFCEKPFCADAGAARRLAARCAGIGAVGYLYRSAAPFAALKQALDGGALGAVRTVLLRIGGRGGHAAWKHRRDSHGGAINEMASHMVDLALWYFGRPADMALVDKAILRPSRQIDGRPETVDAEDYAVARLTSATGARLLLEADMVSPAFNQFVEVQADGGTAMVSIRDDVPSFLFAGARRELAAGAPPYRSQMAAFVEALRGGDGGSLCTFDQAAAVREVLDRLAAGTVSGSAPPAPAAPPGA